MWSKFNCNCEIKLYGFMVIVFSKLNPQHRVWCKHDVVYNSGKPGKFGNVENELIVGLFFTSVKVFNSIKVFTNLCMFRPTWHYFMILGAGRACSMKGRDTDHACTRMKVSENFAGQNTRAAYEFDNKSPRKLETLSDRNWAVHVVSSCFHSFFSVRVFFIRSVLLIETKHATTPVQTVTLISSINTFMQMCKFKVWGGGGVNYFKVVKSTCVCSFFSKYQFHYF